MMIAKLLALALLLGYAHSASLTVYVEADCAGESASESKGDGCHNEDGGSFKVVCAAGTNGLVISQYSVPDCAGRVIKTGRATPDGQCHYGDPARVGAASYKASCSGCFTSTSTVVRPDGSTSSINDVDVDDYVLAARPDGTLFYDKVFRITHYSPDAAPPAIRIATKSGHAIELTGNHYLHAGACCDPSMLTLARDVKVGDTLFVTPQSVEATGLRSQSMVPDTVVLVEQITAKGSFNIHTLSSNVVVNGVATSHFTTEGDKTFPASMRNLAPYWYKMLDMLPLAAENAKAN